MTTQKLAIGSVLGAVVIFGLGIVIFDMLFLDYYTANAGAAAVGIRASQAYWAGFVGALGYGATITLMIGWLAGASALTNGLKAGALAGFLLWFTVDFTIYGYLDLWNITVTVLDIVLETIRAAITGAVVALVISRL